jgi:hypothetical protein
LGHCGVDIGQNLDPIPPAMITKCFAIYDKLVYKG